MSVLFMGHDWFLVCLTRGRNYRVSVIHGS